MQGLAQVARIAMWIMIIVIVLSFFVKGTWIRVVWGIAAGICLICLLLIVFGRKGNSR